MIETPLFEKIGEMLSINEKASAFQDLESLRIFAEQLKQFGPAKSTEEYGEKWPFYYSYGEISHTIDQHQLLHIEVDNGTDNRGFIETNYCHITISDLMNNRVTSLCGRAFAFAEDHLFITSHTHNLSFNELAESRHKMTQIYANR